MESLRSTFRVRARKLLGAIITGVFTFIFSFSATASNILVTDDPRRIQAIIQNIEEFRNLAVAASLAHAPSARVTRVSVKLCPSYCLVESYTVTLGDHSLERTFEGGMLRYRLGTDASTKGTTLQQIHWYFLGDGQQTSSITQ